MSKFVLAFLFLAACAKPIAKNNKAKDVDDPIQEKPDTKSHTEVCLEKFGLPDALLKSEHKFKKKFDVCIDLDITSPLRKINDIKNALNLFFKHKKTEILFSVSKARRNPYFNMVEINNRRISIVKKNRNCYPVLRRQDAPNVYDMNASIYIWKRSKLLKSNNLFSKNTNIYEMPQNRSIDIDNHFDLEFIKYILRKRND